jgi:hypothetical protein
VSVAPGSHRKLLLVGELLNGKQCCTTRPAPARVLGKSDQFLILPGSLSRSKFSQAIVPHHCRGFRVVVPVLSQVAAS